MVLHVIAAIRALEQYVSVPAIRRRTGLQPGELGALAKAGDSNALTFCKFMVKIWVLV